MQLVVQLFAAPLVQPWRLSLIRRCDLLNRKYLCIYITQDTGNPEGIKTFQATRSSQRRVHYETVLTRKMWSYAKQKLVVYLPINGYIFLENIYLHPGFYLSALR